MTPVMALVGRNLRLFFRDRMNVFFSLLGALILFLLYTLFLGNMQRAEIEDQFAHASSSNVHAFVDSWMFAGIVLIGTITTGLSALNALVEDGESGRFRDFLVSPTRQGSLVLGYLLSAISVAVIMSAVVVAVSVLYLGIAAGLWLNAVVIVRIGILTLLCCVAFTAFCAFIVSFVHSSGAYSALNTIVGTATGFIAAAYIPLGVFPKPVADTVSALPPAQAGMLLRREFTESSLDKLTGGAGGGAGGAQAANDVRDVYGIDLTIGSFTVSPALVVTILVVMTIVLTLIASVRIRSRIQ